ncbi:sigma-70 family RNA polymerase sigma factor [Rhodococcus pyridinivorans]|uniref:RNA polymerase sigma factor n=1 Tax=Rhodococcus TaxID=1827 RepID=UPI001C55ADEC|nr:MULTISPECIES: sigma-70 family RNA polymerase sigma factor [Rhodococcus]MCW3469157.1 sigma-70 family RNA polymerase sigma factor [Rhodococcus pyridinivorans]QXU54415.1 sigma-70 family RNA polymerase sigma factor [Rhodococcus sp. LW-XY12]UPW03407.1 sigma-70 family RNA polymerase sigma factor [Rhodococcus pyridinivorans]
MGHHPGRPDRELAAALRNGEPDATAAVFDRFAPGLYAYACGFVAVSSASDVVYDAVWTATARIRSLRDESLLRAWLYAVVRAECIRVLERTGSALEYLPAADPAYQAASDVLDVREAVHLLDGTAREVVDLTVRHHFSSHEIEALLGSAGDGRVLAHAQDFVDRAVPRVPNALGTFSLLPFTPLPAHLRGRLLTVQPSEAELLDLGRRLEPLDREGFPRRDRRAKRTVPVIAASVAVFAVLGVGALFVFPQAEPVERQVLRPAAEPTLDIGSPVATSTTPATTETTTTEPAETTTGEPEFEAPVVTPTSAATAEPAAESTAASATTATSTAGGFTRRGGPGRGTEPDEDRPRRDTEESDTPNTGTPRPTTGTPTSPRPMPTLPTFPPRGGV